MPWKECTAMSLRAEFVRLALQEGANLQALCRRFGISRKTAYKWLQRYHAEGWEGLPDRSRRPHSSPRRSPPALEAAVLEVRQAHPTWGGRKIPNGLLAHGRVAPASPNTVTAILRRHGSIDPDEASKHRPWERFEAAAPNALWPMDFQGDFPLEEGGYGHPRTRIDDHSRYLLGLWACPNETQATVRAWWIQAFREYGLPERILVDNGPPWGDGTNHSYTRLTVWWIRLGIRVCHSRPYHPQTLGKDERLHRTLQEEVLEQYTGSGLADGQEIFTGWRDLYNWERPHEALGMQPPASRYHPS
ncbi:IS481 family transposase, partial [Thermoflexus sp.]|uniref:IS481 family transposase n=1 Tax=Thermoflexus sp. TaxID=1969742 RepID=UPI0035E464C2